MIKRNRGYSYTEADIETIQKLDKKVIALPKIYRILHEANLEDLTEEELRKYEDSMINHMIAENHTNMSYNTKLRMTGLTEVMYDEIVENYDEYIKNIANAYANVKNIKRTSKIFSEAQLDKLLMEREELYRHGYYLGYRDKTLFDFIRLMYNAKLNEKYEERLLQQQEIDRVRQDKKQETKELKQKDSEKYLDLTQKETDKREIAYKQAKKEEINKKRIEKAKETRKKNRARRLAEMKKSEERANAIREKYFTGY